MKFLLALPGGAEWLIILIVFAAFVIPFIFYLLTLQSTLLSIAPHNRKLNATSVWFLLIPLFSTFYHFNVVSKMADSISNEATEKGINIEEKRPAYNIGLAMCILNCLLLISAIKTIASIGFLVCWIIYWIKINKYKNLLSANVNINTIGTNLN